jgi:hypothetical protein
MPIRRRVNTAFDSCEFCGTVPAFQESQTHSGKCPSSADMAVTELQCLLINRFRRANPS